jgi:hypothetical protein
MSILDEARALMAVLQPLTGTRAAGNLTVRSTGATGLLPANAFAVPIVAGVMRHDLMIKTALNPANPAGWPVGIAGTAVPAITNIGGAAQNVPADSPVRWWPAVEGIEPMAAVAAGGLAGAQDPVGLTAVRELELFEQLRPNLQGGPQDLFRGTFSRFPAVMVTWEGSGPGDNQTISPLRQEGARVGRGRTIQKQEWNVFIVTSRLDSDPARREEGLVLVDAVAGILGERQFVDGFCFSAPAGAFIRGRSRWLISPAFYVYRIELVTTGSRVMQDARTYNPWLTTRLDVDTTDPVPFPVVDDNRFPMG